MVGAGLRGLLRFIVWFLVGSHTPDDRVGMRRRVSGFVVMRLGLVFVICLAAYSGAANPALTGFMVCVVVLVAMYGFVARSYARDRLFVAATRELDGTTPLDAGVVSAPSFMSTHALQRLTLAVDRMRRGDAHGARAALTEFDDQALEPDERRMLMAIRALAASCLQDHMHAGMLAISGFPTGAREIDERVGRLCLESAFHDGTRLHAMLEAWRLAGVDAGDAGPLAEVHRLALLKLNRLDPAALPPAQRKAAAQYARALGDPELEKTLLESSESSAEASTRYR